VVLYSGNCGRYAKAGDGIMARPCKPFEITAMKVPLVFRERITKEAEKAGIDPSDYLYAQEMQRNDG
jgi:hypothetical protein